jgi:hypothetical protein
MPGCNFRGLSNDLQKASKMGSLKVLMMKVIKSSQFPERIAM